LLDPADQRPIAVVPDWIREVLSPSTAARDRVTKRNLYATSGVRHYWIIDDQARILEAFELSGQRWVLSGSYTDDAVVRVAPFEAIELPVGRVFLPRTGEELDGERG
jgi:Uma2 family endonuclease